RHQSTNWYFPPLRFPGQYFDAETDLHENWNRFYDPQSGRYLSPEPMLEQAIWLKAEAASGFTTPTYAYTRNNPLQYTDPTGLFSWKSECPDIGGVERGFALQKTVFGRRWIRTPGSVGLDNPLQSACEDLKIAETAQQQMISNRFSLLAGSCWADMLREIRAACDKEKRNKCGSPPQPSAEPPSGYADR
ncbi:MAG: RHS repeat-associated core domain-containing protein, partial [Myxococcota bacterium]